MFAQAVAQYCRALCKFFYPPQVHPLSLVISVDCRFGATPGGSGLRGNAVFRTTAPPEARTSRKSINQDLRVVGTLLPFLTSFASGFSPE